MSKGKAQNAVSNREAEAVEVQPDFLVSETVVFRHWEQIFESLPMILKRCLHYRKLYR